MKINIVLPNHAKVISGGYKVIFEYANYLAKKGNDIIIYYMMNDFKQRRHVPIQFVPVFGKYFEKSTPKWFQLDNQIKRKAIIDSSQIEEADITIATDIRTVEIVKSITVKGGTLLYLIQGYETWQAEEDYIKSSFSCGMNNVVVAKWLKEIVDKYSDKETVLIPNGIDGDVFRVDNSNNRDLHSLSFHYRSAAYKGCNIAIKVIEKLYTLYPDLVVHIVSSEKNIPTLPDCCHVHVRIKPEEVAKIDNSVNVFLCTSREEGYGLPGLEALACGAVLVSTNYYGIREYAIDYDRDHENGNSLLTKVDDVDGLVERVSRVFNGEDLRQRIENNGLRTASELTVEKSATKFEQLLRQLVKAKW